MALTANQIYELNHMNATAFQNSLGQLISDASDIVASEISLADGKLLVGNSGGVSEARTISGDITISNAGVAAIAGGCIINADVKSDAAIDYSKLAALTSNYILAGVSNIATVCSVAGDISMTASGTAATFAIAATCIVDGDINASAAIAWSKMAALADGHILVGSSGNVATDVAMSGDVTILNTGVTAIAATCIVDGDINASAAIAFSKLAALSSGNILVGSAGNVATSVVMSGDATISNAGVVSLAANPTKKILTGRFTIALGVNDTSGSYDFSPALSLPDNAVVTRTWVDVLTTMAGDGDDTSTIALTTGETANDIVSAVAIKDGGNPWDAGFHEGISDGTAANFKKTTAARVPKVVIAIAATDTKIASGDMVVAIEYVVTA